MKKIKILTIGDMPFSPSGVGTQSRYIIEGMLKTGKYQFVSLGGAIKHHSYKTVQTEQWKTDWIIHPVDGYGTPELIRSIIRNERPDILWFMTDPRFWGWLWSIENEIRPLLPMVYYHVWDNTPYPDFNKPAYLSNDLICCISKVTADIVKTVCPEVESKYLPHAVDTVVFKKFDKKPVLEYRKQILGEENMDKILFFWNNRNARRKQSGSLIFWFKAFLDKVGKDKACLLMHTEPTDENGQNLYAIIKNLGLTSREVLFSEEKMPAENLAMVYNMADCTINIADAEGFGLSTLESLSCETPIIVNMTGGLQEQVTDGDKWFGIGLEPTSKAIIGSQDIPYIYEDRLSEESVVEALMKIYEMKTEEREELGRLGREHISKNYNFENFVKSWDDTFTKVYEKCGSWETRKNYKSWTVKEM